MSDEDEEHVISQNHISSFDLSSIDEIPIPIPELSENTKKLANWKEEMVKKINQKQKHLKQIPFGSHSYKNSLRALLSFIQVECGNILNFLKHLFYSDSKVELNQFISFYYQDKELLKQESFNKGIKHCVDIIKSHFRSISYSIRSLPHLTEDQYNAIRNHISYQGLSPLSFSLQYTMPQLYWLDFYFFKIFMFIYFLK
jgi:hypothetical protein